MQPMRFYLVFDVQGNAQQQLSAIGAQFLNLGTMAESSARGVDHFHGTVIAMIHGLRQLEEVGHSAMEWGTAFLGTLYQLTHGVFETAASFETMRERMNFAFNDQAPAIWRNIQQYAVDSVWRFGEVADVVGGLGIAIRGLSDEFETLPARYASRTGDMVNALQVMGDVASGTGRSLSMVGFEVEQMMTGMFRGAHMVLRLTQQETETIKNAIHATADAQEQFSAIMNVLAAHYGGATEQLQGTFNFLAMQIPDILEVLQDKIGHSGLLILSSGLSEVVHWLRELSNDKAFIDSLAGAFDMVARGVVGASQALMGLGRYLQSIVAENPGLVRFALAASVATAALATLGGLLLSTTAGVGVLVASLSLAGTTIISALGTSSLIVAGLVAGLTGLVALGAVLKRAYDENLGGIADRFHQVSLIVQGLGQAFQNWTGNYTAITSQLADQMENAGVLDFFVNLLGWITRAREWWTGFVAGIQAGFSRINWGGVLEALGAIERMLLQVGIHLNLLSPAAETSFATMQERGRGFAELLNQVIVPGVNLLIAGFQAGVWIAAQFLTLAGSLVTMSGTLLEHWSGVQVILAGLAIYFFPVLGTLGVILTYTNSWGTAMEGVGGAFKGVLTIAETLLSVILQIASVAGSIPSWFGFSGPAPSAPTGSTSERRSWDPFASVGTPQGETIPAATVADPMRVEMRVPAGGQGQITPDQIRDIIRTVSRENNTTQRSEPGGFGGWEPYRPVTNVLIDGQDLRTATQRADEENAERRGGIPYRTESGR